MFSRLSTASFDTFSRNYWRGS